MTQPRKKLQAALFLSTKADMEAMRSPTVFYVVVDKAEFQIQLATVISLVEGFSYGKPCSFKIFTTTGELDLRKPEGSGTWEISVTVGSDVCTISPLQESKFMVRWVEAADSSAGVDGYVAIYRHQPMCM